MSIIKTGDRFAMMRPDLDEMIHAYGFFEVAEEVYTRWTHFDGDAGYSNFLRAYVIIASDRAKSPRSDMLDAIEAALRHLPKPSANPSWGKDMVLSLAAIKLNHPADHPGRVHVSSIVKAFDKFVDFRGSEPAVRRAIRRAMGWE